MPADPKTCSHDKFMDSFDLKRRSIRTCSLCGKRLKRCLVHHINGLQCILMRMHKGDHTTGEHSWPKGPVSIGGYTSKDYFK